MKSDREILEDLINEKLKKEGPCYFEFEGQNCEEECSGWDGIERRCECGNRRVTWVLSDDKTQIYAEAY